MPLPTALYAVNVTVVVLATAVLVVLGHLRGLTADKGVSPFTEIARQLAVAAVFLLSIPIAYGVHADAAKLSWISLVVIGPVVDRLVGRRRHCGP